MSSVLDIRTEEITRYVLDNPDLTQTEIAFNLGISTTGLCKFIKRNQIERVGTKRLKVIRKNQRKCLYCGFLLYEHDQCEVCEIPLHDTAYACLVQHCESDHWARIGNMCTYCYNANNHNAESTLHEEIY